MTSMKRLGQGLNSRQQHDDYSKLFSSSTVISACFRMRDRVERLTCLCMGTVSFSVLSGRHFYRRIWPAPLADHNPSVSLECRNDPVIVQDGYFVHTAISICSAFSLKTRSSSTVSRYRSIASRIFSMLLPSCRLR